MSDCGLIAPCQEELTASGAAKEVYTRRVARSNLLDFAVYTKPDYEANEHHRYLCEYLDKFVAGDIKRLLVFMPPRSGKSELVSRRLPAYIFGVQPDAHIISCSYSADLSSRMNRDVQRIIDSPRYKYLFPDTRLNASNVRTDAQGSYLRNSDVFEIVGHTGMYRSAGVGGGITGLGADFGIIDDPVKNQEEAMSSTYREKMWEWYTSTFYTRLEKDGRLLLTMTRWHEDDLAGRIVENMKTGGEEWTIINLPAIAEGDDQIGRAVGEALWPNRFPLETLSQIKATLGSFWWSALYQQRPSAEEGEIFRRNWWQFYRVHPRKLGHFDEVIQSWDCAFKDSTTSDYVVGQVWGRIGPTRYLLDQVRGRMDFPATLMAIQSLSIKWMDARRKLIEDKANGPAVIQQLKSKLSGLVPVTPEGGKVVRARASTAEIEAGNVYLPAPEIAVWVHDFIEECAAFPTGRYDDQVDAMTQAMIYFNSHDRTGEIPISDVSFGDDTPGYGVETIIEF